ncbi:hypothetical protein ACIPWF_20520 [Paenarthrobacter sp. NPDC089989]|uniref:hypothetical protein n=1 Tax=unclassified Paenarthrobacter TaxID=2634190 RepID=UPI0038113DC7
MVLSRQLLFRSAIWEIARPRHPLTTGHLVVRLSDPSTEFGEASAADWLLCHNLARAALQDVLGAVRCAVMFAHRWHPLGSALGEPVAESSTPTFHLFGRWASETTTPGRQLALPAHRRLAEPEETLERVDAELRESLRFFAEGPFLPEQPSAVHHQRTQPPPVVPFAPGPGAGVVRAQTLVPLVATVDASRHHSVIEPASGTASIAGLLPGELVAMAASLGALPLTSGLSGFSCVAVEGESAGSAVRIHAVGRSGAEDGSPLLDVFRLPEVSLALL